LADTIHYIAQQVLTPGQLEVFLAKHPRDGGRETSFHQVAKTRDVRRSGVAEQYHAAIKKVYEAMQILNVDVY
jgi:hypothetical protein